MDVFNYVKQYFTSQPSKMSDISDKYSPNFDELVAKRQQQMQKKGITEELLAVNNIFPNRWDTSGEKSNKFVQLTDHWPDKWQIWPLYYVMRIKLVTNGLTSAFITNCFRRSFHLADGRTAIFNSYVPSLCLPMFFGPVLHYTLITEPMMSGVDSCSLCISLKAGIIQSLTSTLYPLIYSSISCIYFADYFVTYPTPDSINDKTSRSYLYNVWLKAIKRHRTAIISFAVINFFVAFYLTQREQQTTELMYFTVLRNEHLKRQKLNN
ncbi:uncharacterized protein LOC128963636 [Oppia nitens]|uniref:uncharacterized protein LOC128963636 n=1 Tax=Oppia nitens TaxID=1686743 RepID=UPI0023DBE2B2|nr:uncharacterized protein LOC128963636 [Oppia nitens]